MRTRFFANQAGLARLASGTHAALINALIGLAPTRWLMQAVLGIDRQRPLPQFSRQRLSDWFARRTVTRTVQSAQSRVVLFNDTYTEHYLPQVGRAAIEVLEAAGYQVALATLGDSQRSAISQGLLDQAKRKGTRLFQQLDTQFEGEIPILVCEPSCASALADDLPDLLDDAELAQRVANRVQMLDHFLERELAAGRCKLPWKKVADSEPIAGQDFLVHGHCHQKTLDGGRWTHRLLARIPGAIVQDTEAGCCGMAGAFGYELEHAELSRSIAAQRLLPRLSKAGAKTQVVSNGFSCRHQISDLSGRKSRHVVEVIRDFL